MLNWPAFLPRNDQVPSAILEGSSRSRSVVAAGDRGAQLLAVGEQPPLMLYGLSIRGSQSKIAAAAILGSSIRRSTKLVALPVDLISRLKRLKSQTTCWSLNGAIPVSDTYGTVSPRPEVGTNIALTDPAGSAGAGGMNRVILCRGILTCLITDVKAGDLV